MLATLKLRSFWIYWLRQALLLLLSQALLALVAWLLYSRSTYLQSFFYSDILLLFGTLELMLAGAAMMSRSQEAEAPLNRGVQAYPVQGAEGETNAGPQSYSRRRYSWGLRLAAGGLLMILFSALVSI
jgi:hypothetical protein